MLCVSFAEKTDLTSTGYSVFLIVQKVQRDLQDTEHVVSLFFQGERFESEERGTGRCQTQTGK